MTAISIVFIALCIYLLNEYRLIKKYSRALENNFQKTTFEKAMLFLTKPWIDLKHTINRTILNNDLNY